MRSQLLILAYCSFIFMVVAGRGSWPFLPSARWWRCIRFIHRKNDSSDLFMWSYLRVNKKPTNKNGQYFCLCRSNDLWMYIQNNKTFVLFANFTEWGQSSFVKWIQVYDDRISSTDFSWRLIGKALQLDAGERALTFKKFTFLWRW